LGEEFLAYNDSLYTIGHNRTLQENRIRHEVYTKEREIDEQKLQLAAKNHKITVLAIGLGLLTLLFIFVFSANRKRDKLYKTIVARNSEFIKRDRQLTDEIESLRKNMNGNRKEEITGPLNSNPKTPKSDEEANKDLMERFISFMENKKGYADPQVTLASIAKELGTNRTYLSKAINAETGKTFLQIINEYRMRHAVEVISDTNSDIPIKQLAADLGYNSMSTFYTSFNTYTGMTPAKYRDQVRRMSSESNYTESKK
ncbi:MAG: helix-turn-helix transcriptional regulator, partial [Muribaculaceae bacterium]|nr:helix-turn-helix transcriptional regulator [Muribaculaceae bacterium]